MLASVTIETVAGRETLVIDGGLQDDSALVENAGGDQVRVTLNGQVETFDKADFVRIRFLGRSGDERTAQTRVGQATP